MVLNGQNDGVIAGRKGKFIDGLHAFLYRYMIIVMTVMCMYMLIRDAEGRKEEASKVIKTMKQHTQGSHFS